MTFALLALPSRGFHVAPLLLFGLFGIFMLVLVLGTLAAFGVLFMGRLRLNSFQNGVRPGDRPWVLTPGNEAVQLTVHSREGDTVSFLLDPPPEGSQDRLLTVPYFRLFPSPPSAFERFHASGLEVRRRRARRNRRWLGL